MLTSQQASCDCCYFSCFLRVLNKLAIIGKKRRKFENSDIHPPTWYKLNYWLPFEPSQLLFDSSVIFEPNTMPYLHFGKDLFLILLIDPESLKL
jgi:hypothetical protein